MNEFAELGEFVQSPGLTPERHELVKLHVADTLGALLAGYCLEEGRAIGGAGFLAAHVVTGCATARSTEMDDIHLASCTTPGSVIVPTALALAASGNLRSWGEFAAAVAVGYELLIRLGYAIDGPAVLLKKVWPTCFAAPLGSAAVAARAFGLNAEQTAGALATALTLSTGTSAPARTAAASRWLTLGAAAANGVLAARGARQGLSGAGDLLDRYAGRIAGVRISRRKLLDELGSRYLFDEIGCKPYPIARQALAAVEAVRELLAARQLDAIEEVVVALPEPQRAIVDHPESPTTRMEAIISVQHQISKLVRAKVRVCRAADLEKHYPDAWPARVEINGLKHEVLYPRGDYRNPFDWDDVARKFPKLPLGEIRNLRPDDATPALWELIA